MLTDPLFIVGIAGITVCLLSWIRFAINENETEPFVVRYISTLSFISGAALLLSIFYNSGDLGIVLLAGSVVAFIVMVVGFILKNNEISSTARGYFIPILLIFILRTFLYEPYQIPSGSMEPQLEKGDFLLVNKFAYGLKINRIGNAFALSKDPDYGDVVVFIPPHVNVPYIKRLIGKPGDTIGYLNKKIYVNGQPIDQELISTNAEETLLKETFENSERIIRIVGGSASYPEEFEVPINHYFVMGDNRDNSSDSRYFGFVPRENFMGTGQLIWMTWECWTCLPSFERAGFIK